MKPKSSKAASSMPDTVAMDRQYQAQQDMHTLKSAHEIMADKVRHSAAQAHAMKEITAMQRVAAVKPMVMPKMPAVKVPSLNLGKKS